MSSEGPPPQPPKKPRRFNPVPQNRRVVRASTRAASGDAVRGAGLAIHQQRSQISKNGMAGGTNNSSVPNDSTNQEVPCETNTTVDSGNSNKSKWSNDRHPPTILPLRRPSSEDPEILNKLEFGENQIKEPNESYATSATKLGLYETNENPKLIFIQLPYNFPYPQSISEPQQPDTSRSSVSMIKAGPSSEGKEMVMNSPVSGDGETSSPRSKATEPRLPPPHGKLLVYKSGKIQLKMGELRFNVSPGIHSDTMTQDIVAVNTEKKSFYQLGAIENKMLVIPDFSDILDREGGNNRK